jgi:hypothetical protein
MKVYRIEHQIQQKGPFQTRGKHCVEFALISHASEAIPDVPSDFGSRTKTYHVYAFTKLRHLRRLFNSPERRNLARRNFVIKCFYVSDYEVGHSGYQCRFDRSLAVLLWTKKL